jgi:hypothetical protein
MSLVDIVVQTTKLDWSTARVQARSIAASIESTDLKGCKKVISVVKKLIKTKSCPPLERLIALYVHH